MFLVSCSVLLLFFLFYFFLFLSVLIDLHWLPAEQRDSYKIVLLPYKIINGLAPTHLSNRLSLTLQGELAL